MPFALARLFAHAVRIAARATGSGASSVPGKVLLALYPNALAKLGSKRAEQVVLISATNGKTTLTAMLAQLCAQADLTLVHNVTGANLRSGIATTLLTARRGAKVALLETDEATLPLVAPALRPSILVLGNLFRDQLDRYGELETLADHWRDTLLELDPEAVTVVYNADDPLIEDLVSQYVERAREAGAHPRVVPYGCDDASVALREAPHAADSKFCRRCHTPLTYAHNFIGHLGSYACENCGFSRPPLTISASRVQLDGLGASSIEVATLAGDVRAKIRIPGLYNVYNAVGAVAAGSQLGLSCDIMKVGLEAFSPAFGRFERIKVPGGTLTLLLVKNPTGLNEVVRTLVDSEVELGATMFALSDGIADGRDTSWVWDADVEPLLEACPSLVVSGDRAAEFALRAVYGGADAAQLTVQPDLEEAMFALLERARSFTEHGHSYALLTYTSMLSIRKIIRGHGWVSPFWEKAQQQDVGVAAGDRAPNG